MEGRKEREGERLRERVIQTEIGGGREEKDRDTQRER
jgi:hypothetical protein